MDEKLEPAADAWLPLSREGLSRTLAEIVVGEKSGLLELTGEPEPSCLELEDGKLFLRSGDSLGAVAASLGPDSPRERVASVLSRVAMVCISSVGSQFRFRPGEAGESSPDGRIGPLPTAVLAMEVAVAAVDDDGLLSEIGGPKQLLVARLAGSSGLVSAALGEEARQLLVSISRPRAVDELLAGIEPRRQWLRLLRGLLTLGLVERLRDRDDGQKPHVQRLVSADVLDRFNRRIEEALGRRPLILHEAEHRKKVAALFTEMAGATHYQILGVDAAAPNDVVAGAYEEVARLVHPGFAERLGFVSKAIEAGGILDVLFERATLAYLVLTDPERRSQYNLDIGIELMPELSEDQLDEERRRMAQMKYARAQSLMRVGDYYFVTELLKDAVRLAPKPEYFALLGVVQAKNPNWQQHAVESFSAALRLKPGDPGYLLQLARLHEEMHQPVQAITEYQAVLEKMPGHPDALRGLERLTGEGEKPLHVGLLERLRRRFLPPAE